MTCIAALVHDGVGYIAGERGASTDYSIHPMAEPKIWKHGEYLLGYYGVMSGERLKFNFFPPDIDDNDLVTFMNSVFLQELHETYERCHIQKHEDFELLVVVRGKIFVHNSEDMTMTMYDVNYMAEGSGCQYATGVLYATEGLDPEERLRMALGAAVKFNPFCLEPIDILSSRES